MEFEGPHGVKASLDEKEKMIQSLKKKLKMSATEHPQTAELAALEQEKETFKQEALNYKDKVLQLEKEKESWSQGQVVTLDVVAIVYSTIEIGPNANGLVQAMSQVSLKEGKIKNLRGDIERLHQEMKIKNEKMTQFQRENQEL